MNTESPTPAPALPELLTMCELADYLRVGYRTIKRMHQLGQLPAPMKLGGRRVWRLESVRDFLRDLEQEQTRPGRRKRRTR